MGNELLIRRSTMFDKPSTKLYLIKDGIVLSDGITLNNFSYNSAGFLVTPNSYGGYIHFDKQILNGKKYMYFKIKSMQNASNYTFTGQKNDGNTSTTITSQWYTINNVQLHNNASLPYSKFFNAITQARFGANLQTSVGSNEKFRVFKTYNVIRVYDAWMSDSTTDYQEEE